MLCVVDGVTGLTCLDDVMYVVCAGSSTIRLYNTDTFSPLDVVINVDGMRDPHHIVVCRHDRQLYVADWDIDCIWRVSVDDKSYVEWLTESMTDRFTVKSLSLTSRRLIVTSWWPSPSLRQFNTTDTQLLCVVSLPGYMWNVHHGVETTHGTFVVAHEGTAQREGQYAVSELFRLCHVLNIVPSIIRYTIIMTTISILLSMTIVYYCSPPALLHIFRCCQSINQSRIFKVA